MKLSARNQLPGTVVEVEKGAVNATVKIDLGGGTLVTAMITNGSAEELGLGPGKPVYAVIKASDVLVGTD